MAKVFSFDAFRRNRDREAAVVPEAEWQWLEGGAPPASDATLCVVPDEPAQKTPAQTDDDGPLIVSRRALRDRLAVATSQITELFRALPSLGAPTRDFDDRLAKLRPDIDEFHRYCPPVTRPYSPCAADARATLTKDQWNHWQTLIGHLEMLAAEMNSVWQRTSLSY